MYSLPVRINIQYAARFAFSKPVREGCSTNPEYAAALTNTVHTAFEVCAARASTPRRGLLTPIALELTSVLQALLASNEAIPDVLLSLLSELLTFGPHVAVNVRSLDAFHDYVVQDAQNCAALPLGRRVGLTCSAPALIHLFFACRQPQPHGQPPHAGGCFGLCLQLGPFQKRNPSCYVPAATRTPDEAIPLGLVISLDDVCTVARSASSRTRRRGDKPSSQHNDPSS
jgi:hypothetical protein